MKTCEHVFLCFLGLLQAFKRFWNFISIFQLRYLTVFGDKPIVSIYIKIFFEVLTFIMQKDILWFMNFEAMSLAFLQNVLLGKVGNTVLSKASSVYDKWGIVLHLNVVNALYMIQISLLNGFMKYFDYNK